VDVTLWLHRMVLYNGGVRGLVFLVITIVLVGCDAPSVDQKGLVLVNEEWAMPSQTPLSPGFYGSTARTRVDDDPFTKRKGATNTASVADVLEREDTLKRWPAAAKKLKDPDQRGFIRLVGKLLIGIEPGSANPPKYAPRGKMSGEVYWVEEQVPKLEPGWAVVSKSVRMEELPLKYKGKGYSGGGVLATFDQNQLKWDLSAIDVDPSAELVLSFGSAWKSPYSKKSPTGQAPKADPTHFDMYPLVIAKVAKYQLSNAATQESKTVELLTGWIEGAGRFTP
jgi:hypothetical protein